MNISTWKSC